jgi:hypothetical protein
METNLTIGKTQNQCQVRTFRELVRQCYERDFAKRFFNRRSVGRAFFCFLVLVSGIRFLLVVDVILGKALASADKLAEGVFLCCLRAALSGNGLRQSGIIFCFADPGLTSGANVCRPFRG